METSIRLDKWLFFCRFFKSRSLAANVVESGGVRLNGLPVAKPAHAVKPGDRVSFPAGPYLRTVEVVALGTRRGPALEAQGLYRDLGKERAPEE
ncbi:RNA-binding S4 domain-containing protein [Paramagnetospirillum magneticum]|uniref:Ribosome-associated heat shock protein implicated in the recycling of the 50S subunit n=1 Tax=Paramagnetospirillum magneticum (strain ATCC 700264 / AMB-1) TaxID=342108 RepID=Q2VYS4_PARM1|nr:RNA-binding S4 domain-containing protein [Paramagnetospirillum magneticum]BAE53251.1 Ribosome-associated heat shock protein implicated in the recycling of the 50S subunit [Paramagnetospirillum magneticum AMB-1]